MLDDNKTHTITFKNDDLGKVLKPFGFSDKQIEHIQLRGWSFCSAGGKLPNVQTIKVKPIKGDGGMSNNYEPQTEPTVTDLQERLRQARKENQELKNAFNVSERKKKDMRYMHMAEMQRLKEENEALKSHIDFLGGEKLNINSAYMELAKENQALKLRLVTPVQIKELEDKISDQEQEILRLRIIRDAYEFCITNLGCKK